MPKKRRRAKRKKAKSLPQELILPVVMSDEPEKHVPVVNMDKIMQFLVQGRMDKICDTIMQVLNYFEARNFKAIDLETVGRINDFVGVVFSLMVNPNFTFPGDLYGLRLIAKAHIFANVVRLSAYGTTDSVLTHIMSQPNNYAKMLFLYTSRNNVRLPVKELFDANAKYASLWYFTYILPTVGAVTPEAYMNLRKHIEDMDERYTLIDYRVTPLFFACTYLNDTNRADLRVKRLIGNAIRKVADKVKIKNTPDKKSIAIVTSKWFANSAVYKSSSPLIKELRKKYKLTLIHLGKLRPVTMMKEHFDKVHYLEFDSKGSLATEVIENNDFQMVYFPDVGMNNESVWLSSVRWAPIQVTSYGHPVSTFSKNMDYFIVGSDSEVISDLEKNYSERTVVIPGIGAHPSWPNYMPKFPPKRSGKMIVNCPWGPDKYNERMFQFLRDVARKSNTPVEFQLFCSRGVHRYQGFIPFQAEIKALLPGIATLHADKEYYDYMAEMEYADFAINSWPFGGYNTVVESLFLNKPVVTREGDKFYNKACACLLRKVGLDDLIAQTPQQFAEITLRLLNEPDFLHEKQEHLRTLDLKTALFDTDEPAHFAKAIDYLIENHDKLKAENSRTPIIIERD